MIAIDMDIVSENFDELPAFEIVSYVANKVYTAVDEHRLRFTSDYTTCGSKLFIRKKFKTIFILEISGDGPHFNKQKLENISVVSTDNLVVSVFMGEVLLMNRGENQLQPVISFRSNEFRYSCPTWESALDTFPIFTKLLGGDFIDWMKKNDFY